MKLTTAAIMKRIKQLAEDKEYWEAKEKESCTYIASVNETPVVPEYDYDQISGNIQEINEKIQMYKHAINKANVETVIKIAPYGDCVSCELSIDMALIEMAQLNKRKEFLDGLRKKLPKQRVALSPYTARSKDPEYEYINFDPEAVKRDYEMISEKITSLQIAIDKHNQTFEIEMPDVIR